jgi:hypothetical protein
MQNLVRRTFLRWLALLPACQKLFGSPRVGDNLSEETSTAEQALRFARTLNTIEARHQLTNGCYADMGHVLRPGVLEPPPPGWQCELRLTATGGAYSFRLWEDGAQNGLALASDHSGRIYAGRLTGEKGPFISATTVAELADLGLLPLEHSPLAPYSRVPNRPASLLRRIAFADFDAMGCNCQPNPDRYCSNIGDGNCVWCCFGDCPSCCEAYGQCVCCDCRSFPPVPNC